MTFLALDVGNTRLKWAQYEAPVAGARVLAHGAVFLENIDKLADEEWNNLPAPTRILGCIVAGDAVKRRVIEQMELW
ncbi:MAG: type III pantothenate kinase, partial [Haliea sp.]